jgi:hypothetical protein
MVIIVIIPYICISCKKRNFLLLNYTSLLEILFNSQPTRLVIMAPQKAPQKLYTVNPGTIHEAMMKAKALIIMIKKPRVKIVMGRVKRIRTGLIKVLISPKTRAASRAENTPSIRNPGIRASAINRARLFINSVRTQFIASLPLA